MQSEATKHYSTRHAFLLQDNLMKIRNVCFVKNSENSQKVNLLKHAYQMRNSIKLRIEFVSLTVE